MKTIHQIFLYGIAVSLFSIISCQKTAMDDNICTSNCLLFEGTLKNFKNKAPVGGALVQLIYEPGFISVSEDFEVIDSTFSDENGFFELSTFGEGYINKHQGYFIVQVIKHGYLLDDYNGVTSFHAIDATNFDIPFKADIKMYPGAVLKITKSSEGQTVSDFNYQYTYIKSWIHPYIENGRVSYETALHNVAGDEVTRILYSYAIGGNSRSKSDSIYIDAGEVGEIHMVLD